MIKRIKKGAKWLLALKMAALLLFAALAAYSNVPTWVTASDKVVFIEMGLVRPNATLSFEQQVALIRRVQFETFKRAPLGVGIPDYQAREPSDLMKFGQGLCFDRSRTFDKAFTYLGLDSRHVYLLYKGNLTFWDALFHKGQTSHAVTEVKTSKGWMFVDSNTPWVAITRHGEPVSADEVWQRFDEFDNPPHYLAAPWWAIRGMYSRKGQLYGAGIVFPELNWVDFLSWWVLGM